MARYSRLDVLNELLRIGLLPLYNVSDSAVAFQIARACLAGGARVVEFTNRGDFAWQTYTGLERMLVKEVQRSFLARAQLMMRPPQRCISPAAPISSWVRLLTSR